MRYFIGFLVTIGLVVLVLFLLLSGGSSSPKTKPLDLGSYAYSNAAAQLIIDGPIVSDQNHREVKIDVTQNQISLTVYQGYQQNILTSQTYPNNESSFAVFLHAMQLNGFATGNPDPALHDERGRCANGNRNIYTFNDGTKDLTRFWSTSCSKGTFKGQAGVVINLFKQQVPDYTKQTLGTSL